MHCTGVPASTDGGAATIEAEPDKFLMPSAGDLRYRWIEARLDALDHRELRELITDAWRKCVPKRLLRRETPS